MTAFITVAKNVLFFLSAGHTLYTLIEPYLEDEPEDLKPNHKVDAILDTDGLITNPVDAAEEQYIQTVQNGLANSSLDPQIASLAIDTMRVCPTAHQYRTVRVGRKKVVTQGDVTADPWVRFKRDVFLNEHDDLISAQCLVIHLQQKQVEYRDGALYFLSSTPDQYIARVLPSTGAYPPTGAMTTLRDLFLQATKTRKYREGHRVAVRIKVSSRPYSFSPIPTTAHVHA